MDRDVFVQNIKAFCQAKGVPPTVACRESGVGASFINDIRRGQTPSVAKVQMLAAYLGVTTSELLGEGCGPLDGHGRVVTPEEFALIQRYREKPELRHAVRVLLGLE